MKYFKRLLVCLSLKAANMGDNSGDCTLYHCNDNITRHLCFNTCKSIGHGVTLSRSSSFFDGIPRVCVKSRDCVTSYPLLLMIRYTYMCCLTSCSCVYSLLCQARCDYFNLYHDLQDLLLLLLLEIVAVAIK